MSNGQVNRSNAFIKSMIIEDRSTFCSWHFSWICFCR